MNKSLKNCCDLTPIILFVVMILSSQSSAQELVHFVPEDVLFLLSADVNSIEKDLTSFQVFESKQFQAKSKHWRRDSSSIFPAQTGVILEEMMGEFRTAINNDLIYGKVYFLINENNGNLGCSLMFRSAGNKQELMALMKKEFKLINKFVHGFNEKSSRSEQAKETSVRLPIEFNPPGDTKKLASSWAPIKDYPDFLMHWISSDDVFVFSTCKVQLEKLRVSLKIKPKESLATNRNYIQSQKYLRRLRRKNGDIEVFVNPKSFGRRLSRMNSGSPYYSSKFLKAISLFDIPAISARLDLVRQLNKDEEPNHLEPNARVPLLIADVVVSTAYPRSRVLKSFENLSPMKLPPVRLDNLHCLDAVKLNWVELYASIGESVDAFAGPKTWQNLVNSMPADIDIENKIAPGMNTLGIFSCGESSSKHYSNFHDIRFGGTKDSDAAHGWSEFLKASYFGAKEFPFSSNKIGSHQIVMRSDAVVKEMLNWEKENTSFQMPLAQMLKHRRANVISNDGWVYAGSLHCLKSTVLNAPVSSSQDVNLLFKDFGRYSKSRHPFLFGHRSISSLTELTLIDWKTRLNPKHAPAFVRLETQAKTEREVELASNVIELLELSQKKIHSLTYSSTAAKSHIYATAILFAKTLIVGRNFQLSKFLGWRFEFLVCRLSDCGFPSSNQFSTL